MPEEGTDYRLWGGRFATSLAPEVDVLNRSLPVDARLWAEDIRVCSAWVRALAQAGVIPDSEAVQLCAGLDDVAEDLQKGIPADAPDEDIHTLVERLLQSKVGDVATKIRTGRSRNDQVSTDLRLWAMEAIDALDSEVCRLGQVLLTKAGDDLDTLLPGYTHGQQAQPIRWAHFLLAHAWPLVRDRRRLHAARESASVLPLGAAALAGSGFAIDRELLRRELGFASISGNSLDATGDRDFVVDAVYAVSMIGVHLSRLASEIIVYASTEYGFVHLSDAYSTGSSLMPQKRNPDVFELARGKAARAIGDLVALLSTLKGLPHGYQKDLQEDKAILFGTYDQIRQVLAALHGAVLTLEVDARRMHAVLGDAMKATDLADLLVEAGVAFGTAHAVVGRLVYLAEANGTTLTEVDRDDAAEIHPDLPGCLDNLGDWSELVERRSIAGGTAKAAVQAQLVKLHEAFA